MDITALNQIAVIVTLWPLLWLPLWSLSFESLRKADCGTREVSTPNRKKFVFWQNKSKRRRKAAACLPSETFSVQLPANCKLFRCSFTYLYQKTLPLLLLYQHVAKARRKPWDGVRNKIQVCSLLRLDWWGKYYRDPFNSQTKPLVEPKIDFGDVSQVTCWRECTMLWTFKISFRFGQRLWERVKVVTPSATLIKGAAPTTGKELQRQALWPHCWSTRKLRETMPGSFAEQNRSVPGCAGLMSNCFLRFFKTTVANQAGPVFTQQPHTRSSNSISSPTQTCQNPRITWWESRLAYE